MSKQSYVYIMASNNNRVLYTGVTSELHRRVYQHKEGTFPGFTRMYNVKKLVYFEIFDDIINATARDKQIKDGPRRRKVALINSINPDWDDLSEELW